MPFPDYEEFIASLNEHGMRYLIVVAHHRLLLDGSDYDVEAIGGRKKPAGLSSEHMLMLVRFGRNFFTLFTNRKMENRFLWRAENDVEVITVSLVEQRCDRCG